MATFVKSDQFLAFSSQIWNYSIQPFQEIMIIIWNFRFNVIYTLAKQNIQKEKIIKCT